LPRFLRIGADLARARGAIVLSAVWQGAELVAAPKLVRRHAKDWQAVLERGEDPFSPHISDQH